MARTDFATGKLLLIKALALLEVCKQEPGLAHGTLLNILKDEDSKKVTRAAKTVAAIGDEGLLQVLWTFGDMFGGRSMWSLPSSLLLYLLVWPSRANHLI